MKENKKSLRNFWRNNLLAPRVVVVDKPGIIYNILAKKYGKNRYEKRIVWCFEDLFANLYKETLENIGKEKTSELWYQIGKDISTRYLLLNHSYRISPALREEFLEHIFKSFQGGGQSFSTEISFNEKELTLMGRDSIFCRKIGDGSFSAGVSSGIVSFIYRENMEAEFFCSCPNCHIKINSNLKKKYIPNFEKIKPEEDYHKINFPANFTNFPQLNSFQDLMKFNKIILSQDGKFQFYDNSLIAGEVGMLGIITKKYLENDLKKILFNSLIETSEKVAKDISNKEKKISFQQYLNLLSALGNGVLRYKILKNNIIVYMSFPPYSKYGFLYYGLLINGFINHSFDNNFLIGDISFKKSSNVVIFNYIRDISPIL